MMANEDEGSTIPDEVLLHIFAFVRDMVSLCQAACVCRRWNRIITTDNYPWEQAIKDDMRWGELDEARRAMLLGGFPDDCRSVLVEEARRRRAMKQGIMKMQAEYGTHASNAHTVKLRGRLPQAPDKKREFKVIVMGEHCVGKTWALIAYVVVPLYPLGGLTDQMSCTQFSDSRADVHVHTYLHHTLVLCSFIDNLHPAMEDYVPTIWDYLGVEIVVNEVPVRLGVWDSTGRIPSWYKRRCGGVRKMEGTCFLLCFSLVDRRSFTKVKRRWVRDMRRFHPNVPFLLAGTKLDLLSGESDEGRTCLEELARRGEYPITFDEGKRMAKETGAAGFIPFSSLTRQNLELVFEQCATLVLRNAMGPFTHKNSCLAS